MGKVFERCIHKHVYDFLKAHTIIAPLQSGFIPGDSTVNQLLSTYHELCTSFDKGVTTQVVYLDISKAFDRVWHQGLLLKLKAAGIRGKLFEIFKDYLSNRYQSMVVKGQKSDLKCIPAGVTQGSVLGPLLFLIYVNDIVNEIEPTIKLFADDTSLSLTLNDPDIRAEILKSNLDKIKNWAKKWKVKFNEDKTDLLNITRDCNHILQLTFGTKNLEPSQSHKHLGLIVQHNCRWDEHIRNICQKVNMLISCLRNYKYKLNRKSLETMYKSFILPHFDYADIIWDKCTETQSNLLENMHLEAIRTIIGAVKGTNHQKMYEESGFCSLKERRRRHKLTQYHKIVNGLCPEYLQSLLPSLVSELNPYHRRRRMERTVPRCRTELNLFRSSFFPSTTTLWNNLPENFKQSSSLSEFKRLISLSDKPVPHHYYIGIRQAQIVHCRLRLGISNLKFDLVSRHLEEDPGCTCGYPKENAEHYLLFCPNYDTARTNTILTLQPKDILSRTILYGDSTLTRREMNSSLIKCLILLWNHGVFKLFTKTSPLYIY